MNYYFLFAEEEFVKLWRNEEGWLGRVFSQKKISRF